MPEPAAVPRPTFLDVPDDLGESFQLAAIPVRDVAGLAPPEDGAATEWLPDALAALASIDPVPTTLSRLSVYEDSVHFSFPDPEVPGRTLGGYYRDGEGLRISEPRFDDSPTYELALVQPDVPTRIRDAIEARFPTVTVTDFELSPGLSYEFGLVWYITVADARGTLATVFADVDGAIVAVDEW